MNKINSFNDFEKLVYTNTISKTARDLGISRAAIKDWLRNRNVPFCSIQKVSYYFKVNPKVLNNQLEDLIIISNTHGQADK